MQAVNLLRLPDLGEGELNAEQRREALNNFVSLHKPLSALSLFLGVVALEDFIRDLVSRMAENTELETWFPNLGVLRNQPQKQPETKKHLQLDTDPAGNKIRPEQINKMFQDALGISPIPDSEYSHLRDLALLRHTVAHHAAVIRHLDVPRFQYFIVQPGRIINPPLDFVTAELHYLYLTGRNLEKAVMDAVFGRAISYLGSGWSREPSRLIIQLIEFFAYFGYLESTTVAVGYSEPESELRKSQEIEAARIRNVLLERCLQDLIEKFGP